MRRVLPFLLVAAAVLAFYGDVLFTPRTFFYRDLSLFHYPHRVFWRDAVRAGELPLWNPGLHLGMPYAGEMEAAPWYPPNALFLALPPGADIDAYVVLHDVLAGIGACGLAACLGLSAPAATLAGVAWALSGDVVGIHWNWPFYLSACWLPWALWAFAVERRRRSWRARVLVAAALAALLLAGDPQAFISAVIAMALYAAAIERPARWWRAGTALAGMAGGALVLAAVELAPALELYRASARAAGLGAEEVLRWSFQPARLAELFVPFLWHTSLPQPMGGAATRFFWLDSHFVGAITAALALAAFLGGRHPARRWLAVTAVVFVALASGGHLPLYATLLDRLPGFAGFRYPEKFFAMAALALVLAGAIGLDEVRRAAPRRRRLLPAAILAAAALGLAFLYRPDRPAAALPAHAYSFFVHAGVMALVLAAVLSVGWRRPGPAAASWLVVALAGCDLALVNGLVRPVTSERLYREPPAMVGELAALARPEGEPLRLYVEPALEEIPLPSSLAGSPASSFWQARTAVAYRWVFPHTGWLHGFQHVNGFSPLAPAEPFGYSGARAGDFDRMMDLFGVRALIVRAADAAGREAEGGYRLRRVFGEEGMALLANEDALPRAFVLPRPAAEVLRAPDAPLPDPHALPVVPGSVARILAYGANRVTIYVETRSDGVVVLSDRVAPGWRASVDGSRRPIRPFARVLRSVEVPAGRHRVDFVYRPASVVAGAAVSGAAIVVLLGTLLRTAGRRGRFRLPWGHAQEP